MQAHEIDVTIPEDHRLTVEVPASVRSGPAKMILLVPEKEPSPYQIELSSKEQEKLWQEWVDHGPQGPIEDEGDPEFP